MSEPEQAASVAASFSAQEKRRTRSATSRDRPSLQGGARTVPATQGSAKGGGTRVGSKVGAPAGKAALAAAAAEEDDRFGTPQQQEQQEQKGAEAAFEEELALAAESAASPPKGPSLRRAVAAEAAGAAGAPAPEVEALEASATQQQLAQLQQQLAELTGPLLGLSAAIGAQGEVSAKLEERLKALERPPPPPPSEPRLRPPGITGGAESSAVEEALEIARRAQAELERVQAARASEEEGLRKELREVLDSAAQQGVEHLRQEQRAVFGGGGRALRISEQPTVTPASRPFRTSLSTVRELGSDASVTERLPVERPHWGCPVHTTYRREHRPKGEVTHEAVEVSKLGWTQGQVEEAFPLAAKKKPLSAGQQKLAASGKLKVDEVDTVLSTRDKRELAAVAPSANALCAILSYVAGADASDERGQLERFQESQKLLVEVADLLVRRQSYLLSKAKSADGSLPIDPAGLTRIEGVAQSIKEIEAELHPAQAAAVIATMHSAMEAAQKALSKKEGAAIAAGTSRGPRDGSVR